MYWFYHGLVWISTCSVIFGQNKVTKKNRFPLGFFCAILIQRIDFRGNLLEEKMENREQHPETAQKQNIWILSYYLPWMLTNGHWQYWRINFSWTLSIPDVRRYVHGNVEHFLRIERMLRKVRRTTSIWVSFFFSLFIRKTFIDWKKLWSQLS